MNAFYRLAIDLYAGQKTPEQVRALCEAMAAFLDISNRYIAGQAMVWDWRREYERLVKEITKL